MDRKAFYKLTYGLYIVSARADGRDCGCVVNTLEQVTSEPPKMAVALNKNNFTEQMIEKSGYFAAVALTKDADLKLIGNFGFKSGRDTDKFAAYPFARDENGVAYVTQSVAARYSLQLSDRLDLGTHVMLIGDVLDAEVLSGAEPLTYTYYQQVKKGTTPKNAPSYQKPTER
jgi:flavin reductase (DIM6/NTAB) family NADH-FMN oxidoreductase RutF